MFGPPSAAVSALTLAMFLVVTAFTFLAPLLVDMAREFGTTVPVVAQLTAATSLTWAFAAPLIGPLSDRLGRRPILVVGTCGMALTTIAVAFAQDIPTLLALRVLTGLAGAATAPMLTASTGDLFQGAARVRAFGWVNGGWGIAAVAGVPTLALIAGATHWRVAFAVVGSMLLVLAIPLSRLPIPPGHGRAAGYVEGYRVLLRRRVVWFVLLSNALERALYAAGATYFPPFLIEHYGLSLSGVAPVLALSAIGGVVGNLAGGRVGGSVAPARLFALCQGSAGFLALAVLTGFVPLVAVALLIWAFAAVNAYSRPVFLSLVTDVGGRNRGSMVGILAVSNQGGYAVGAATGGLVIALAGYSGLSLLAAAVGCGAALAALELERVLRRRHQPSY